MRFVASSSLCKMKNESALLLRVLLLLSICIEIGHACSVKVHHRKKHECNGDKDCGNKFHWCKGHKCVSIAGNCDRNRIVCSRDHACLTPDPTSSSQICVLNKRCGSAAQCHPGQVCYNGLCAQGEVCRKKGSSAELLCRFPFRCHEDECLTSNEIHQRKKKEKEKSHHEAHEYQYSDYNYEYPTQAKFGYRALKGIDKRSKKQKKRLRRERRKLIRDRNRNRNKNKNKHRKDKRDRKALLKPRKEPDFFK